MMQELKKHKLYLINHQYIMHLNIKIDKLLIQNTKKIVINAHFNRIFIKINKQNNLFQILQFQKKKLLKEINKEFKMLDIKKCLRKKLKKLAIQQMIISVMHNKLEFNKLINKIYKKIKFINRQLQSIKQNIIIIKKKLN